MKKKIVTFIIIGILLASPTPVIAVHLSIDGEEGSSYDIVLTYSFETPQFEEIEVFDETFTRVQISGCDLYGRPGEPMLPVKFAKILLPPQTIVKDISVEAKGRTELIISPDIEIGETTFFSLSSDDSLGKTGIVISQDVDGQAIIISHEEFVLEKTAPVAAYDINSYYPSKLYRNLGVQYCRGYPLLLVNFFPVQYLSKIRMLSFYENLRVTIKIEPDPSLQINEFYRGLHRDETCIREIVIVDNPSTLSCYTHRGSMTNTQGSFPSPPPSFSPCSSSGIVDMLIITTKALKQASGPNNLEALKQAHEDQGLTVGIKTMEEIQKDIDATIRDYYNNFSTEYVLLVGDDDWKWEFLPGFRSNICRQSNIKDVNEVPTKQVHLFDKPVHPESEVDGNATIIQITTGSDVPYACFDGENDFYAEVYIGRAPVSDAADLSNFVKKTIAYIQSDYSTLNALFVGERLGAEGVAEYAADSLEEMREGSSNHDYATVGVPSTKYTIKTLYDRDWKENGWPERNLKTGEGGWPKSKLSTSINNNKAHILNHLGHAYWEGCLKLEKEDIQQLKNTEYGIWYSQGCFAGAYDWPDCIGEYFTAKDDHGAVAFIGNTFYGFGKRGSTDGPSQRYCRQFWNAIFGKGFPLGKANQYSKEANVHYFANQSSDWKNVSDFQSMEAMLMRWLYYSINLLGDPALHVKGAPELVPPDNHPPTPATKPSGETNGNINIEYTYSSQSTDPDGDQIYYWFNWGDGTTSGWLGPYDSGVSMNAEHSWSEKGSYTIQVKAKDVYYAESLWSEELIVIMVINHAVTTPTAPSGSTSGKTGKEYTYSSITTDPDGDDIYYWFDWGDSKNSGWIGPVDSGDQVSASHTWTEKGTYKIKVKAKDIHGAESDWSDPLSVSMPKSKPYTDRPFQWFLQNFLQQHPILYQLLQRFLRL